MDLQQIARGALEHAGLPAAGARVLAMPRNAAQGRFVAALVFVEGALEPSLFLKATRDPRVGPGLALEHDTLRLLADHLEPPFREGVPAPLFSGEIGGARVLATTAQIGPRMKNLPPNRYFGSTRFVAELEAAVDWLVAFQRSLRGRWAHPAGETPDLATRVEAFRQRYAHSPRLDALLDRVVEVLGDRVPGAPWHGDFCTANLIVPGDGRVRVVDWEESRATCWPVADLVYLLSSVWCTPYRKGLVANRDNQRRLFHGEHRLRDVLRRLAERFLTAAAIGAETTVPQVAASWLTYANRKRPATGGEPAVSSADWPLVLVENDSCLNLEWLAEDPDGFLLSGLG